jgi:hypothetical protein
MARRLSMAAGIDFIHGSLKRKGQRDGWPYLA